MKTKIRKLIILYILTRIQTKSTQILKIWDPSMPSQDFPLYLYRIFHCTAPFSLPVFFNHIHKVGICLFPDVFEPQGEQGWLVQADAAPAPLLLQHLVQRGLAVAQLLLLGRTQKAILGLWAVSSWSLDNREQNTPGECQENGQERCKEPKLRGALPSAPWAVLWHRDQAAPALDHPHLLGLCLPHLPCASSGATFVLSISQLSKEQKTKHIFTCQLFTDNQPQAQISFAHFMDKILLESF